MGCAELDELEKKVNELFTFRDQYFETHSIEEAGKKQEDVQSKLDEIIKFADEIKETAEKADRVRYLYLLGRARNVQPDHSSQAEELLSRATKLDHRHTAAWNELGACLWKREDAVAAGNCFTRALESGKNPVSLRQLSMVQRQTAPRDPLQRSKQVEESLLKAKEAVELDLQDGVSWQILGNAYLSAFFAIKPDPKLLKQCLVAYQRAERDPAARSSPELHYNRAVCLKYEEQYQAALESFDMAARLFPTWSPPAEREKALLQHLSRVAEMVAARGKQKHKRLLAFTQELTKPRLGMYAEECTVGGRKVKLKPGLLSGLSPGTNTGRLLAGKVVCSVPAEDNVPFTFCLVDSEGSCVAVNVYNLAEGKGVIIGDTVVIPEPLLVTVDVRHKNQMVNFRLIRVQTPLLLAVNGRRPNPDVQAAVFLNTFNMSD
ncbi:tetratricopeptide repeat protein 5-like [Amphibalanus amphitrite]|uniref:tetratricopeptide repeat protein 5-like n=1 Tax=Amphibalanus amphitrite TaxID=1232801 RepID=UPI001C8FCD08|nr:tetratricopeptide repeat protein 5-like [Amphibalanus amphitrite]XP_043212012.1 tetratricopeptide repeat protein 5-like [Amphibalanus amphitrite]